MTGTFIAPAPLYTFLSYCNESSLAKEVLDCGAGGSSPPLTLFHDQRYRTHGIDISDKQLERAWQFGRANKIDLNIVKGDMRALHYETGSMSFVYSYASICHMTKRDVGSAIEEITRVLRKGGLCFISFCGVGHRDLCGEEPKAPGEYPYEENGERGVHSIFGDTEPDQYFQPFAYIRKEKRYITNFREHEKRGWAELLYFAKRQ
jgi:SAM-dependent methyltransferase